ncbi:uncharacterized protein YndB with AHSA1/START domain [Saccharothrix coeruleofusca]|uniref:SRPBCC family protein n=1 Tax=Saccharothrix coeruleofusca TaxID=33919 RepID=UPI001AE70E91|nr:SRPBCC family protein [Saccharothrix coeruleofusca]MBP2339207.1 uncharacterized protein YndB with AHSA1/START domain [Saccharothrix coeruleofusca]
MASYEYHAPVDVPARQLFDLLAQPEALPQHLPGLVADDASLRVDHDRRVLTWSEGSLAVVDEEEAGRSLITLTVNSERGPDTQRELEEAVAALSHRAASQADATETESGNAWY